MKQQFPVLFGAITGLLVLFASYFKAPVLQSVSNELLQWRVIVAAFALLLGIANISRIHVNRVSRKDQNTPYSLMLLIVMYGALILGLGYGAQSPQYKFIWDNVYSSLNATWYSTTAFYMMSSAWRGFRVRSVQAGVLMVAAIVVMLSKVGIGELVWSQIPAIGNWIVEIPNTAGMRGILVGSCLGAVGVSLRIMLGLERGHLGGGSK
ncbi:MAG: hypothetical protein ACOX5Q_10585 [Bacillota bacterium]|nr:hypothetical protein [Candidatus Fermentithermobacillaceae bacterium]